MRVETEFFLQNSVSFSHNSVACAVGALQFVIFKQALRAQGVRRKEDCYEGKIGDRRHI